MANKTHFTVVRNAAYTAASIGVRERHNERKNETYYNADIVQERCGLNLHFRQCVSTDGAPETYEQTFSRLISEGTVVKRGLKDDAKVFDELVFDVNTAYFEQNGGYDFAKAFYSEAYRLAVKEVGSEDFILSAVMHADEKNVALSEQFGYPVFHYHMHVIYVPVVEKEILWSKRCKDQSLVGTVKEVIPQISHSKKWPKYKDATGKWVNEYSLLQDRYYTHMVAAGFDGFERGDRGSTAEHLGIMEYKIQQDGKRLDSLSAQVDKVNSKLGKLNAKVQVAEKAKATIDEINAIGRPALLGGFTVTVDELKKLKTLAKKSVTADDKVAAARNKLTNAEKALASAEHDRDIWKKRYESLYAEVKEFLSAIRNFPDRLREFISRHWHERQLEKSRTREISL
jgi:hypothetical protein